jgi:hypothetical protein
MVNGDFWPRAWHPPFLLHTSYGHLPLFSSPSPSSSHLCAHLSPQQDALMLSFKMGLPLPRSQATIREPLGKNFHSENSFRIQMATSAKHSVNLSSLIPFLTQSPYVTFWYLDTMLCSINLLKNICQVLSFAQVSPWAMGFNDEQK